jgi:hypothetical protein
VPVDRCQLSIEPSSPRVGASLQTDCSGASHGSGIQVSQPTWGARCRQVENLGVANRCRGSVWWPRRAQPLRLGDRRASTAALQQYYVGGIISWCKSNS